VGRSVCKLVWCANWVALCANWYGVQIGLCANWSLAFAWETATSWPFHFISFAVVNYKFYSGSAPPNVGGGFQGQPSIQNLRNTEPAN